ncbi:hypothetical protein Tco_0777584 [Tanacetum coccineum]
MMPASKSLSTTSRIALFISGAWLLFFYLTGGYPSRTFSRCSAICHRTPVMFVGFQANTSRLRLSNPHNAFLLSSIRVEPIAIVRSGYSRTITIQDHLPQTIICVGGILLHPHALKGIFTLLEDMKFYSRHHFRRFY